MKWLLKTDRSYILWSFCPNVHTPASHVFTSAFQELYHIYIYITCNMQKNIIHGRSGRSVSSTGLWAVSYLWLGLLYIIIPYCYYTNILNFLCCFPLLSRELQRISDSCGVIEQDSIPARPYHIWTLVDIKTIANTVSSDNWCIFNLPWSAWSMRSHSGK